MKDDRKKTLEPCYQKTAGSVKALGSLPVPSPEKEDLPLRVTFKGQTPQKLSVAKASAQGKEFTGDSLQNWTGSLRRDSLLPQSP